MFYIHNIRYILCYYSMLILHIEDFILKAVGCTPYRTAYGFVILGYRLKNIEYRLQTIGYRRYL